jgi:solute carrier family 13 (sodium-dependent dicarboxylate transporter), member 2/3/5
VKPLPFAAGLALAALPLAVETELSHWGEHGAQPALGAALTLLMATWWITEAIPIAWTACVPLVVLPFASVYGAGFGANLLGAVAPYVDPYIFLFLGGMGIAAAMQQWGLHRRIALQVMRVVGTDARRLLFGLLLATASVSLWISNTATAAMMFPIGLALIAEFEREGGRRLVGYGAALMLAVAYGSNVGGIGTKIGTVPSAQLSGFLAQRGVPVSFLEFAAIGIPFVMLFLPVVWLALWRIGRADAPDAEVGQRALASEGARLGEMGRAERIVLFVFLATAAVWVFGKPITDALRAHVHGLATAHVEAGIALLASLVLFAWRAGGRRVLEPASLRFVQWETLVLLGGGFSLAASIQASGLSHWLGAQLVALRAAPPFAQVVAASVVTVALSAFASNAATVAVMLPVLASSVAPEHVHTVLFAATFAASCDFALPAGTPPNAIVFGSGYLTIPLMARTGALLDLVAALCAALWCWIAVPVFLSSATGGGP